jgi:predicted lipoprotein with Yx(FWY)xxD motif
VKRAKLMAAISVVAATIVAGCGSSSSSSTSTKAASPATAAASSATTPTQSSSTSTASAAATAAPAALITTKHAKLGTILAYGPKHLTVYLFEADKTGASNCSASCTKFWPPVIGNPTAGGQALSSDLGTIKRADGSTQVTYKGHPLYRFVKDKDDGDAYGEGIKAFGASWYVLAPSGKKVDNS